MRLDKGFGIGRIVKEQLVKTTISERTHQALVQALGQCRIVLVNKKIFCRRVVERQVWLHHQRQIRASRQLVEGFGDGARQIVIPRSEEHTSELQSLMRISYAVFCLKKKINNNNY